MAALLRDFILIEPHPIVLEGLVNLIQSTGDFQVIATATDSDKGFFQVVDRTPDVVVMDLELAGRGALAIAEQIASRLPATRLVFFTDYITDVYLDIALRLRVAGYISKTESTSSLLDALQKIASGKTYYSPEVSTRLDQDGDQVTVRGTTYLGSLTLRQLQVLRHLVRGESVKEVAKAMVLSERAIESHKYRIMQKLGIHDRVELARYAIREGLMPA